jgi:hypothetical protein
MGEPLRCKHLRGPACGSVEGASPPHHANHGRAGDPGLRADFYGTTEQLAEKVTKDDKTIPQGLKPESFCSSYGTAEAVPLQNGAFFRKL